MQHVKHGKAWVLACPALFVFLVSTALISQASSTASSDDNVETAHGRLNFDDLIETETKAERSRTQLCYIMPASPKRLPETSVGSELCRLRNRLMKRHEQMGTQNFTTTEGYAGATLQDGTHLFSVNKVVFRNTTRSHSQYARRAFVARPRQGDVRNRRVRAAAPARAFGTVMCGGSVGMGSSCPWLALPSPQRTNVPTVMRVRGGGWPPWKKDDEKDKDVKKNKEGKTENDRKDEENKDTKKEGEDTEDPKRKDSSKQEEEKQAGLKQKPNRPWWHRLRAPPAPTPHPPRPAFIPADPALLRQLRELQLQRERAIAAATAASPKSSGPIEWARRLIRLGVGIATLQPVVVAVFYNFFKIINDIRRVLGGMSLEEDLAVGRDAKTNTTFADVVGVDEAKKELEDIVEYLKDPAKFTRLGGKMTKGVLLWGPPGTGKTLLARAVAGQAGVPFKYASGSEFEEMYVGVGARRVRDLFNAAKKHTPCIVFIDEIDAIGSTRSMTDQQSLRQTLNQVLTELDGFASSEGLIVIGATNFPEILDKALLRPGRFDRQIEVPNPDVKGREDILKLHTAKIQLSPDAHLDILARGTPGLSGAELASLVNKAACKAAKDDKSHVTMTDLEYAKDLILMGAERSAAHITEDNRRVTAFHEGGHALIACVTEGALPVHKATIVPRGGALGMVMQLPEADMTSWSRRQMIAEMDVCMGGRAAEELVFGELNITSGASSDLERATQIARSMVEKYGMSSKIGLVTHNSGVDRRGSEKSQISEETRSLIDAEVRRFTEDSYQRALVYTHATLETSTCREETRRELSTRNLRLCCLGVMCVVGARTCRLTRVGLYRDHVWNWLGDSWGEQTTLRKHRATLNALAAALIDHETLTGQQVRDIVRESQASRTGVSSWLRRLVSGSGEGAEGRQRGASERLQLQLLEDRLKQLEEQVTVLGKAAGKMTEAAEAILKEHGGGLASAA